MAELHVDLIEIANRLDAVFEEAASSKVMEPLGELEKAAITIGKAWSGSWLGYHTNVYYRGLKEPPPGAHFSQEWGLKEAWPIEDTTGEWKEFSPDTVLNAILRVAENPDLSKAETLSKQAEIEFKRDKLEVLSILSTAIEAKADGFLEKLRDQTSKIDIISEPNFISGMQPSGTVMSRDSLAITQGFVTPPHISVMAKVMALRHPLDCCRELGELARNAGSHISRKYLKKARDGIIGTNVFIGHGKSLLWRELKDFVNDRLHLPWDEFNRVPVAGVTNIARLSELLDSAAIAFLVMTGEDEQSDGKLHARMNVIHEAGLFQGRLGFTKAIVVLEDGCEEFSNIQGLGQIRFPKGNIRASFEEIRQVLKREGILEQS